MSDGYRDEIHEKMENAVSLIMGATRDTTTLFGNVVHVGEGNIDIPELEPGYYLCCGGNPSTETIDYIPASGVDFSTALIMLKLGHKVYRGSWIDATPVKYIILDQTEPFPTIYAVTSVCRQPLMFAQADLLANDWYYVE